MRVRFELDRMRGWPPEEPVFVLRGQDELSSQLVLAWADLAEKAGVRSGKVAEARRWAKEMANWPSRKLPD